MLNLKYPKIMLRISNQIWGCNVMKKISINYKVQIIIVTFMVLVEYYLRDFSPNLLVLIIRDVVCSVFISIVLVLIFIRLVFVKQISVVIGLFIVISITGIYVTLIALMVIYQRYHKLYLTPISGLIILISCIVAATYFVYFYRKGNNLNKTLRMKNDDKRKGNKF